MFWWCVSEYDDGDTVDNDDDNDDLNDDDDNDDDDVDDRIGGNGIYKGNSNWCYVIAVIKGQEINTRFSCCYF